MYSLRPRGRLTTARADMVLALGLLAVVVVESTVPGRFPSGGPLHWLPASAVATLSLAFRRTDPLAVLCLNTAAMLVQSTWLGFPQSAGLFVALLVATYTLAVHGGARARGLGLAVLLIVVPWSMSRDPSNTTVLSVLPGVFLEAGAWAAGAAVRSRHERAAQAQAQAVEATRGAALAAADERMRIARELHDTVAHGLSVVVVQASMATLAWERGDPQVGTALAAVERSGRDALAQLRQLVDVLRPGVDHGEIELSRGLHQLPALLDGIRDTGVRVEYEDVSGLACADLPALVEHAVYRIVQEALTNVVKHVGPTTARVRLERVTRGVRVRVEDDGPQPGPAMRIDSGGSSGVGHIGLRERVTALGGSLQVGREGAGGYAVTATVPVESPAR